MDLLVDSFRSSLEVSPQEPDSSSGSQPVPVMVTEEVLVESPRLVDAEFVVTREEKEEKGKAQEIVKENTIRLVGSGASSELSQSEEDSEPVLVASAVEVEKQRDLDVRSIKSVDSFVSTQQPSPKNHKKAKSAMSGLRRLSGFGLKKKGSAGSVKSIQEGQQK